MIRKGRARQVAKGDTVAHIKFIKKLFGIAIIRPVESAIIRAVWIFATESEMAAEVWGRFTVHYTPTHGSWLNQAEIEIGIFSRQCLGKHEFPTLRSGKPRPGIVG
jgi:hypothetical protein